MHAHVLGIGLWTPGYPTFENWVRRDRVETPEVPPVSIASPRLLRGTSMLTRLFVEAAAQAATIAQMPVDAVATVFGSAYGETHIALAQFEMMRTGDGLMSPHRFKNSVHNTGAGVFSIAAQNRGFTTALAAGSNTTAMALLEGFALLHDGHEQVVVCVADEPLPMNFAGKNPPFEGLGVAFALRRDAGVSGALARLSSLGPSTGASAPTTLPDSLRGNPIAPALVLAERIVARASGAIPTWGRPERLDGHRRMSSLPPIDALLPQRPPMRLVDRVASFSGEEVRTESRVRADWPFAVEGVIDSATSRGDDADGCGVRVALAERATPSERAGIPMLVRPVAPAPRRTNHRGRAP
ncbi:MAG: beta-ketoacyl synthase chain length factor [Polyangiales bacterium]